MRIPSVPPTDKYNVYRVQYHLALKDLDVDHVEYHTVLFVETDPATGHGTIHHVGGDITARSGMHYQSKPSKRPEDSETYHSKCLLGTTNAVRDRWDGLLANVHRPPQQKAYNIERKRTEPFRSLEPLAFYDKGQARRPLSKCTEWVDQEAIPALIRTGLLSVEGSVEEFVSPGLAIQDTLDVVVEAEGQAALNVKSKSGVEDPGLGRLA